MKRKIFNVLFALVLVLSFSLVIAAPATPAMANGVTTYYVATTGNDGNSGTSTAPWLTIQHAIDTAASGDTIVVRDGTYTESLSVTTDTLTLMSENGRASTTIVNDGAVTTPEAAQCGFLIRGTATDFILGGASGHGFTLQGGTAPRILQLNNAPSDVTISYNTIDTESDANYGINIGAAGATGLTISYNTFTGDSNAGGEGSIFGSAAVDLTVTNNIFTGSDLIDYAVQFYGVTGTSVINENTITDYKGAGAVVIVCGTATSGLTISGNSISGCVNGIRFANDVGTGDITTVTVTENILTDNAKAIRIGDGAHIVASDFVIEDNNISGSTTWGLQNEHTTEAVTAENNWWGSANGPTHSGNTFNSGSQGDAVTGSADYVPWLNAGYATGTSFAPVKNITDDPDSTFSSIQAAIDASTTAAGETITCEAGTYNGTGENFPIDISKGITLKSVAGAATTIINGGSSQAIAIATNGVTLGATGYGFTIKAGGSSTAVIVTNADATSGITIQGNIIRRNNRGQNDGIYVNNATSMTIDNNSFYGDELWTSSTTDADIEGGPGTAIVVAGSSGAASLTVKNNTAYNLKYTFLSIVGNVDGVVVYSNTLHDLRQYAVDFYTRYNTITIGSNGVNIYKNTIYNNGDGIHIAYTNFALTGVGYIVINYNDIYSNNNTAGGRANVGVENIYTATVNAKYNYWGDASGPAFNVTDTTGNDRGAGDALSANVTYEPWLTTTQATVYPSGIRYYGYNWCSLTQGWNVWSTPIAPDTHADTWGEYKALGTDLALATGANAYSFNGTSQTWASVTDSYALTPCDAIYINMASAQTSPILFSPIISAPSKALSAGWNLVSASYIDDMNNPVIGNGIAGQTALNSVYYVAGANNVGYSQVVSPAAGQAAWGGVRGPAIDTAMGHSMLPCKGYWVYMTNAGTLAGTVFTPVSPLTNPPA